MRMTSNKTDVKTPPTIGGCWVPQPGSGAPPAHSIGGAVWLLLHAATQCVCIHTHHYSALKADAWLPCLWQEHAQSLPIAVEDEVLPYELVHNQILVCTLRP
jgi:hypothetical protein